MRVGQGGGGMAVLDPIMLRLGPARVAGEAVGEPEAGEVAMPSGEELVGIGLVAGVEQDGVMGGSVDPVQRQGQLDYPQVRSQVTPVPGDRCHDEMADLGGQSVEFLELEGAQVGGPPDGVEERSIGNGHGGCLPRRSLIHPRE